MTRLSALYVYPIKSLRGIALDSATITGGRLNGEPPDIEYVPLWRRRAPVTHVSHEADAWFSAALSVADVRLMAFVTNRPAVAGPSYERSASLHDATPFHLTSEDSLHDLNQRMRAPIPMNRFRPNIVVRGAEPYAEDAWKQFAIGEMSFQWIKPCTRCAITTTDQITGARQTREPLRTLATYRRVGNEVMFGHYVVALRPHGTLRIGDNVVIQQSSPGQLGDLIRTVE